MNASLVRRSLVDLRWHIAWYGVGLAIYAALMVLLYPTFEEFLRDVEYPEGFLDFFGGAGANLSTPEGFITTEYFSIAPVIMIIYAVVSGTGMLAGDEGRGTLEILLAQPISRFRLFASRVAALLLGAVLIGLVNTLGWLLSVPFVDVGDTLGLGDLVFATFAALPVVTFFGALAMLLGAIAPSRGTAAGILAALVIVTYLLASFSQTIEALEWTRNVNPYWYSDGARALTEGVVWWHQGLLLGGAAILMALAAVAFAGREIDAGVWQPSALARGWRLTSGGASV
ncbi:MAG: ABC transporter permease subunit [Dehalococcoidia bacterium]|nr:ABC transporter permease subunit [Dehalococcoidia bacterium]